jgi:NAD+--asparagine ADP-ribosyltransferase
MKAPRQGAFFMPGCEHCAGLDGKRFKVSEMEIGKNAPPLHPNCRCSIAPYDDSAEYDEWLENLENGGTTEEWEKQKAVEKADESGIIRLKSPLKINIQYFAERDMYKQESASLKRAIRKYIKNIELHNDKVSNPEKYCDNWQQKDDREKAGLIKHWKKEIRTSQQSIDDRIEELKKRGDYDE